MKKTPTLVDLFCGCGGFSLGAHRAGFKSLLGVDIDPTLSSAFKLNFGAAKLANWDLSKISGADIYRFIGSNARIDGITGGPPCQGFSLIGRRKETDERNSLVVHFARIVSQVKPKFFVLENVPGILSGYGKEALDAARNRLNKSYTILDPIKVNAADFGAPTARQRIFIIGYDPDEVNPIESRDFISKNYNKTNVRQAIGDISDPEASRAEVAGFQWARVSRDGGLSEYARSMRSLPQAADVGWKVALEFLRKGFTTGLMPTEHRRETVQRFAKTKPESIERISRLFRMSWDGYCRTLRAGTGSDRGSYQSARPIHPEQPRVISVREAARLQGFPDWYVFHPTIWHSFRMIGNSVSPMVSAAILASIRQKL